MRRAERTFLDTKSGYDARLCGYDGPRDPQIDGEGLVIEGRAAALNAIPYATLIGPDGSVELTGRSEIEATIAALQVILGVARVEQRAAA